MTIGTRNYVLNSAFDNGTKGWLFHDNCYIDKTKTLNNYPSCKSEQSGLTADSWRGCHNYYLPTDCNLGIKAGETWTFSCWYYVENKTTFDSDLALEIKGKLSGSTNDDPLAGAYVSKDNIIEGKWTRLVKTFTANKDYDKCHIFAYVRKNGTAWFTCFQLEKSTVVSDWNPAPEDNSGRLTIAESNITQLSNSITSMVTENDVKSIIEQNPSSVKIGFNGISDNVVIDSSGLTVNQGAIACDQLCTPSGHSPVINLFTRDGYSCQIDARKSDGGNFGTALRLKYDDYNYYYVSDNSIQFYQNGIGTFGFKNNSGSSEISTTNGWLIFEGHRITFKESDGDEHYLSFTDDEIARLDNGNTYVICQNDVVQVSSRYGIKVNGTYVSLEGHTHSGYAPSGHSHNGYAPSDHSHNGYAPSGHSHSSISSGSSTSVDCYSSTMYMTAGSTIYVSDCDIVGENGSENCGTYAKPWRSVVADMLIYLSYCGKADGDEENLTDANVSYNFMKQYSNIISSKQQLTQTISMLNTEEQNEIFEEEDEMQKAVVEKANAIYEYDEEGINLFTNASVLTETMAQTIEILINKVEELEKTVLDLQNKLGE